MLSMNKNTNNQTTVSTDPETTSTHNSKTKVAIAAGVAALTAAGALLMGGASKGSSQETPTHSVETPSRASTQVPAAEGIVDANDTVLNPSTPTAEQAKPTDIPVIGDKESKTYSIPVTKKSDAAPAKRVIINDNNMTPPAPAKEVIVNDNNMVKPAPAPSEVIVNDNNMTLPAPSPTEVIVDDTNMTPSATPTTPASPTS